MTNIVLCSGHALLVAGFRAVIESTGEFSIAACSEYSQLKETIESSGAHIVMADVSYGFTLDRVRELRDASPKAKIVLWVDSFSTEFISQALSLGVMGVLRKSAPAKSYLDCLQQVSADELWVENELSRKLLRTRTVKLTPRERQLMEMLAQGLRNKEIAFRLGITEGTVKVYLSHLYEKVGASDRFELALLALKNMATDQFSASESLPSLSAKSSQPMLMPGSVRLEQLPLHPIQIQ